MKDVKLIISGKDGQTFRAFRCLLDKLANDVPTRNLIFTHIYPYKSPDIKANCAVLIFCDYDCSMDFCCRWFQLLWKEPPVPLALLRPILMNHGWNSSYYSIEMLGGINSLKGLGNWFTLLMSSPYHVSPQTGCLPPYGPLSKVAAIQHEIISHEGANANRSSLALKLGWHPSHLSHAFRMHVGMPLQDYVLKIKFCLAFRKVVASGKLIKQIAYEAGYTNPLYFGKAFKRRFGISPNLLREKNPARNNTLISYGRI